MTVNTDKNATERPYSSMNGMHTAVSDVHRPYPTDSNKPYSLAPSLVDARHYRDESRYKRELENIFLRSWLPVCRSGDLPTEGDFVVWDRLRQSIFIVRQKDGTAAAWHSECQPRGQSVPLYRVPKYDIQQISHPITNVERMAGFREKMVLDAWCLVGPAPAGVSEDKWRVRNDKGRKQFIAVLPEDSEIINGVGTASNSPGFKRNMFNTAENRLTAFHEDVRQRAD